MSEQIQEILKSIERTLGVKILFAVETGSRLWGMESADSDYDVRFVFVRTLEQYLQLSKPDDYYEAVYDNVDVVGFDIYKFARLLSASNPTVIEWLHSDIVYYGEINNVFKEWSDYRFNPERLFYHYKSMGKENYLKYIHSGNAVTCKKYLYALRGIMNSLYVIRNDALPPIKIEQAMQQLEQAADSELNFVLGWMRYMIDEKKKRKEREPRERIQAVDNFIVGYIAANQAVASKKASTVPIEQEVLRIVLGENTT